MTNTSPPTLFDHDEPALYDGVAEEYDDDDGEEDAVEGDPDAGDWG